MARGKPEPVEGSLLIMDGDQLYDLEPPWSGRRSDDDLVAFFLVEDGFADGRRCGDQALFGVGIFRHDELIDELSTGRLAQRDGGPKAGFAVRDALQVHQRNL